MKQGHNNLFSFTFCVFLALVSGSPQQTPVPLQPKPAETSSEPVVLTVTVTNGHGEFVTGLQQDNFAILVDKATVKIDSLNDEDVPMSIGILFDSSGSMDDTRYGASTKFRILREGIARFLDLSNKSNEYFVIGFNYRPQLLLDWTSDSRAVIDKLTPLQPRGNTALYDACYLGVEKVMRGRFSKRVIILISDGENNESHYTLNDLRRLLKESSVTLYSTNLLIGGNFGSSLGAEGRTVLAELSKLSGGVAFSQEEGVRINPKQVAAVFELIADELRHQYSISLSPPTSSGDKGWHRIKIKVTLPPKAPREMHGLSVRSREGVFVR